MKRVSKLVISGIVIGDFIGFWSSLFFSLVNGGTRYYPSSPHFVAQFSNVLTATWVSALYWAAIGIVFSVASIIFMKDTWSITRMTGTHFLVTLICFTPLAVLCGWFPLQWQFLLGFLFIFICIYIVMWIIFFTAAKRTVKAINIKLKK
ncbi:DUF3021 domain-containing protein [Sporolactobacillus sp. KGMB 08714]|uniref:DUF3021 domain-containing protein n=1 Tax=Sporolactobacillus sp. KGMB 08714 TaxID=3064704 RepID=UPI002FBDF9E2